MQSIIIIFNYDFILNLIHIVLQFIHSWNLLVNQLFILWSYFYSYVKLLCYIILIK